MADISKITLPDDTTYNIKDKNARNFTNTPYYEQDEEALMFQLGESYMTGEQDNQPYSFRAAGGSADIGNREYDKIVGGTVAWNQLLNNTKFGGSFPSGSTNQYDSTTDSTSYSSTIGSQGWGYVTKPLVIEKDHIYLLQFNIEATNVTFVWGKVDNAGNTPASYTYKNGTHAFIQKSAHNDISSVLLGVSASNGTSVTAIFSKAQVFNLTQMFGTTIANYIYSLETATPGAGVAWFRKLFPKPYYEYNPGELMSVQAVAHKLVGFNAWDEEWELGIINTTTGEQTDSNSNIRSKNYIRVIPGATYYFKLGTTDISNNIVFYDAEKNYVAASGEHVNDVFTVPEDAHYMKFYMSTNYGRTYLSNICINLSGNGERDGEYEEYEMHSYPLDSSLVLRGIPKLDANNQLYYDGDVYEADGTVTRRYAQEAITKGSTSVISVRMAVGVNLSKVHSSEITTVKCNKVITNTSSEDANLSYISCRLANGFSRVMWFFFPLNIASTLAEANAWFAQNKLKVIYKLNTPTTETAEPYDNPQIVASEGTEEYITTNIVFVGHETKY